MAHSACSGWQFNSRSSFVLSWGPWILPCAGMVQEWAGDWAELTHRTWDSQPLTLFFLLIICGCSGLSVFWFFWTEGLGFGFLIETSAGQPSGQSSKNGEFIPCKFPVFSFSSKICQLLFTSDSCFFIFYPEYIVVYVWEEHTRSRIPHWHFYPYQSVLGTKVIHI